MLGVEEAVGDATEGDEEGEVGRGLCGGAASALSGLWEQERVGLLTRVYIEGTCRLRAGRSGERQKQHPQGAAGRT